jgi:hypothetical protein
MKLVNSQAGRDDAAVFTFSVVVRAMHASDRDPWYHVQFTEPSGKLEQRHTHVYLTLCVV